MKTRNRILCSLLTIFCFFSKAVLILAQDQNEDQIEEAIRICREKLAVDPHFPKVQYSLAQLLESQLDNGKGNHHMAVEVIDLYHMVGQPSQDTAEGRLPPITVRFDALARAATLVDEILQDRAMAIELFIEALHLPLDGVGVESIMTAFAIVMPMILSSVLKGRGDATIGADGSVQVESSQQLQRALNLCDYVGAKCPNECLVDEYKGATLRKMNEPHLALKSFEIALFKAQEAYRKCSSDLNDCALYLGEYIKVSIKVSAAAREADAAPHEQMEYLRQVEAHIGQFTDERMYRNLDDTVLELGREQIVDLYNNMGIVEKKGGSFAAAKTNFLKALEFKPNDGHALVQLASLKDGTGDDAIANVKDLDPDYVRDLFDGYSTRFESELVDELFYQGHTLVYEALEKAWKKLGKVTSAIKRIIDVGCGTGLLGELLANNLPSSEIHGVDLSKRMVDIATARKNNKGRDVYNSVSNNDAAKYLSNLENESVDAIVAADVFIYIGDIRQVLAESSKSLLKDGLVGFTIESYEQHAKSKSDGGLKLLPSGRFGHSKSYITKVAKAHGFDLFSWKKCVLRQESGKDVDGAVAILKKT